MPAKAITVSVLSSGNAPAGPLAELLADTALEGG